MAFHRTRSREPLVPRPVDILEPAAGSSRELARQVLRIEAEAIGRVGERLDQAFDSAVELIASCRGRVVTTGMGKSGIVCKKIAATLSSTGTPSFFLHPAEAIHGDLGMVVESDVVVTLSNSGETPELLRLLERMKRLGVAMVALTGDPSSTLAANSDIVLDVSVDKEACPLNLAPTASTTAALALGDALAIAVFVRKGFQPDDFAHLHPGGVLGKRLMRVSQLMLHGSAVPRVLLETPMGDAIYEMSSKGLGVTSVVDGNGMLRGVISDGDLRRLLQRGVKILEMTASECMTARPVTIDPGELAVQALHLMEKRKITSLMVTDPNGALAGIIHLHNLWRTELV